jgi:hypothetical protein
VVSFFLFYSVCSSCSPLFGDSPEVACCKTLFLMKNVFWRSLKKIMHYALLREQIGITRD